MKPSAPTRHATTVPPASRRTVVLMVALVAIIHSFLVMLWVMPVNPIRDAVGNQRLTSYINNRAFPFEQSWSVFAPTPRRGGENVLIRAYLGDYKSDTGRLTEWFDITTNEDQRIKYLVNPSRFHSATRRLGGNVNSAVGSFTPLELKIVGANFVQTPRTTMIKQLAAANTRGVVGEGDILSYARNDDMLTRFSTMYATARWGRGVSLIQYRVGHRSVPPYINRKDINFLDVPYSYYTFGLRKAMPGSAQAQAAFEAYVAKAPSAKNADTGKKGK